MPLAGLLLMAVAYVIGAGSFEGLVGLAYFSPLFAVWPLVSAGDELETENTASLVGLLALAGVAGAAIVAVMEVVATGTVRAGGGVANPIHFADVALLVGFLACAGSLTRIGVWRFVYLLGPAFAIVAVVLSGTRGAVVAVAAMAAVAGIGMVVLRLVSIRAALVTLLVLVVGGGLALWLGASQLSGIERVLVDVGDVLKTGLPTDESTAIRLAMVHGGFEAFLRAPIFGHGPLAFVGLANDLSGMPPGNWPHLHNDLADFAASAGVVGLAAFALFLLAPIVEIIRSAEHPTRRPALVLMTTLVSGFFVMGLTNAMFGILTVTTAYAAVCVVAGLLATPRSRRN
jgi:O-antigen ligase